MGLVPSAEGLQAAKSVLKRSKVARRPMTKLADEAFEVIYSNIENGLLKGTSSTNQATVPKGRRLIIEYVSGYIFRPPSSALNWSTTMAVTDPALGLNGAGFHTFPAINGVQALRGSHGDHENDCRSDGPDSTGDLHRDVGQRPSFS